MVQESGSAADTTYKTLLSKLDSDVLDAAYGAVEDLIGGINSYVQVRSNVNDSSVKCVEDTIIFFL